MPRGGYWYSYTLSLNSALNGVGDQSHAPGKPREINPVALLQEAGWVHRSGLDG